MQAIIALLLTAMIFGVGYLSGSTAKERDQLKQVAQAQQRADAAETKLATDVKAIEAKYEKALSDLDARYADSLREQPKPIVLRVPADCSSHRDEAAHSDGLSQGMAGIEVKEREILALMQAADTQTQSLMACQAYVGVISNKLVACDGAQ